MVGIKNFDHLTINQLKTIEGTQFPGKNEIAISKDVVNDSGFLVGDEIEFELPDGSTHFLTVAGLVYDQTTAEYDNNITVNAFAAQDTLRSLGLGSYFNRLLVTVEGDGSNTEFISTVAADVEDKIESRQRWIYRINEKLSDVHPMGENPPGDDGNFGSTRYFDHCSERFADY